MDDEELRAERDGGRAAPPRVLGEPPANGAALAPLPPTETYTVLENGDYYRTGGGVFAVPGEEDRARNRPPDWDFADPAGEPRPKRDDGVWGVVTMQGILAAALAILYVALLALAPAAARTGLDTVKEKSAYDFSFHDALYELAGEAIDTLSRMAPLPAESAPESAPKSADASEPDASGLTGAGGAFSPTNGYVMPSDATFAPIVFTGSLVFPLAESGRQTAGFGFRESPIYGGLEFHKAVDIAAARGTNILAAFDGVVAASGEDRYLGKRVLLDHGHGFFTLYGHCDRLLVREGTRVRAGEVIAKVGSTGDSTGFHLHFGMQMDGLWFDPAWLYPDRLAPGGVEDA